jgi:membrane protein required for beta-lactamase induction
LSRSFLPTEAVTPWLLVIGGVPTLAVASILSFATWCAVHHPNEKRRDDAFRVLKLMITVLRQWRPSRRR